MTEVLHQASEKLRGFHEFMKPPRGTEAVMGTVREAGEVFSKMLPSKSEHCVHLEKQIYKSILSFLLSCVIW